jgi:subtilisin family serine protease
MNASNDLLTKNYDEVNEWNKYQKDLSLNKEKRDETEKIEVIRKLSEAFSLDQEPDLVLPFEDGGIIENLEIEVVRKRGELLNSDQESKLPVEDESVTAALEIEVIRKLRKNLNLPVKQGGITAALESEVVLKRNEVFGLHQRLRLVLSVDEGEVIAALLWMTEQGKQVEDLIAVKNFTQKSEFGSDNIRQLCDLAEKNILRYLNHFKVLGIPDNFNEFEKDIYSIEANPSYSIIVASNEVIERIRAKYPTGKLKHNKAILGHSKDDQFRRFLEHVVDTTMIDIIQLDRSIDIPLKQQVEAAGAEVLRVLSGGKIILSTPNAETRNKIMSMNEVSKVEQYYPSISLEERFIEYLTHEDESAAPSRVGKTDLTRQNNNFPTNYYHTSLLGLLIAIFFKKEYRDKAAQNLGNLGIDVVEEPGENMLVVDLINHPDEKKAFWTIFNQPGLRSIEEDTMPEISSNDAVKSVMYGEILSPNNSSELFWTGKGEIIAIADTGLDTGIKETLHEDLRAQVLEIKSYPFDDEEWKKWKKRVSSIGEDCGAADLYSGHGTHVSGIAIGNGSKSQQQIMGIVPDAQLIFQSLEQTLQWSEKEIERRRLLRMAIRPDNLFGIPTDLNGLFSFAYNYGARIHSNSWGISPSQYTKNSELTDKFMWENKDFLVVVSAGNKGQHKEEDNKWIDVDNKITSPGTSKNCLTVGACENHRFPDLSKTYGVLNNELFPHAPFNQDEMADSFDDIAAFSSRGCFDNGRYKPDVVAPGTLILSTRSSQISTEEVGSLPYETDQKNYMYMCGTSMATPLVAGGAALVRQYLREEKKLENPSAALIKATIIHSAQYVEYRFKNPRSYPCVDHEQGWGRVTLSNSLTPKSSIKVIFEDRKEGLIEDEEYKYQILVENNSEPLKIVMSYTDYPWDKTRGDESKLVNNLNLIAYTPSGNYYIGNHFDEEREFDKKWLDKINNVEGIIVKSPELGLWTVKVVASEVKTFIESGEKQDFALVASYGVKEESK